VKGEVSQKRANDEYLGGKIDRLTKKKGLQIEMVANRDIWRNKSAPSQPTRLDPCKQRSRV
jgi:hypothetical protein